MGEGGVFGQRVGRPSGGGRELPPFCTHTHAGNGVDTHGCTALAHTCAPHAAFPPRLFATPNVLHNFTRAPHGGQHGHTRTRVQVRANRACTPGAGGLRCVQCPARMDCRPAALQADKNARRGRCRDVKNSGRANPRARRETKTYHLYSWVPNHKHTNDSSATKRG